MSDPQLDLRVDTSARPKRPNGTLIEAFVEIQCDCGEWVQVDEIDVLTDDPVMCTCGIEWQLGAEKL